MPEAPVRTLVTAAAMAALGTVEGVCHVFRNMGDVGRDDMDALVWHDGDDVPDHERALGTTEHRMIVSVVGWVGCPDRINVAARGAWLGDRIDLIDARAVTALRALIGTAGLWRVLEGRLTLNLAGAEEGVATFERLFTLDYATLEGDPFQSA